MKKIILLPIEPLEERYSSQWIEWFKKEFKNYKLNYKIINDPSYRLDEKITVGKFLDCFDTNFYKASQIKEVIKMIRNNEIGDEDIIFLMDGWFPGIESLFYIRDITRINFKISAILHAGTWDPNDFLTQSNMGRWSKQIESSWLKQYDSIFVATNYHKKLITDYFSDNFEKKIYVTSLPVYTFNDEKDSIYQQKEYDFVFSHRLDIEKNPSDFNKFLDLVKKTQNSFDSKKFVRTKDVCSNKQEYYDILKTSKYALSFADQETFGISMREAVLAGCIPIVPNNLAYSEDYPDIFKYIVHKDSNKAYDAYNLYIKLENLDKRIIKDSLETLTTKFKIMSEVSIKKMLQILLK